MKKFISVFLSILVIVSCITVAMPFISAETVTGTYKDLTYEISDGSVTITGNNFKSAVVAFIPAEIEGYPVTAIGDSAFAENGSLSTVTLPSSIVSIGDHAFDGCNKLTEINLPNGIISIGDYAFNECSSLKRINIPYGIPDSVTSIGNYTFAYCYSLTEINIPDGVTSIGNYAFLYCYNLTTISLPENITSIGNYAFAYCNKLTKTNIPDGITSIGDYTFAYCSKLTKINIPDGVTSIGDYAFRDSGLTEVNIPDNVAYIGKFAFYSCDNLENIFVSDGNPNFYDIDGVVVNNLNQLCIYPDSRESTEYTIPDSVTSIGDYVFFGSFRLKKINIPTSVTSIGNYAFSQCNIAELNIPNSVTSIGNGAFRDCNYLQKLTVPVSVTSIGSDIFGDSIFNSINPTVYGYHGSAIEKYINTLGFTIHFVPIMSADITAPSKVYVNENFNIEVVTGSDVDIIKVYSERNSIIGSKIISKEVIEEGARIKWTLSLSIGTAGKGRIFTVRDGNGNALNTFTVDSLSIRSVIAPEEVTVNEKFTIEIQTASTVKRPIIINEKGKMISSTIVSKEINGNTINWILLLSVGTVGNRELSIVDSSVTNPVLDSFIIFIDKVHIFSIISVTAPKTVKAGESFEVTTVVTSDMETVKFVSENGNTIGSKVVSKVKIGGFITSVHSLSVVTPGQNRHLSFLAGYKNPSISPFPYRYDFYLDVV